MTTISPSIAQRRRKNVADFPTTAHADAAEHTEAQQAAVLHQNAGHMILLTALASKFLFCVVVECEESFSPNKKDTCRVSHPSLLSHCLSLVASFGLSLFICEGPSMPTKPDSRQCYENSKVNLTKKFHFCSLRHNDNDNDVTNNEINLYTIATPPFNYQLVYLARHHQYDSK